MTPFLKSARQILKNFKKGSRISRTSTHFFTDRLLLFVVIFGLTSLGFSKNGKAQETSNYNSIYFYVTKFDPRIDEKTEGPDYFMEEPNQTIINNLKAINCNSVFMSIKTSKTSSNTTNIGLYTYPSNYIPIPPTPPYAVTYQQKLTDFIHLASIQNPPIKVFAFLMEKEQLVAWDVTRLDKIAYYQRNVRNLDPYKNKLCLFNGIVTNIEPWGLTAEGSIIINGDPKKWHTHFCENDNRDDNQMIMSHYLDFIPVMRQALVNGQYFNPLQPNPPLQIVDNAFMGTTHWYLHYFSMRTKWVIGDQLFPAGNFSLMVGPGKFDIIIPQTYCGKNGDCLWLPCINSQLTSFCRFVTGFDDNACEFEDNSDNDVFYNESAGSCFEWFEKHFVTDFMYKDPNVTSPPYTIPVDAAPMLYGHTAAHDENITLTQVNVINTRHLASRITSCYNKPYRGSVIFDYDRMKNLPTGNLNSLITFDCDDYLKPPNPIDLPDSSNYLFSVKPNPASNMLYVEGLDGSQTVLIYNIMNEKKIESRISPIDVTNLQDGFYIMVIIDEGSHVLFRQTISIRQ